MSELREKILAAEDLPRELVEVPEWDVTLWVTTLPAAEKDAFELSMSETQGGSLQNFRARLVARTACDENGQRIFSDADAVALGQKSSCAMSRVFNTAAKLNHLLASDVAELAGNFAATPDDVPNGT